MMASHTILIVEDEPKISELLKMEFEQAGYRVVTALTGTKALAYLTEHQPSMVLLDVRLPDMSGHEVCKTLRARYDSWSVPVLMLTAMDQPIDQLRGFAFGADVYMTKPFNLTEVLETAQKLLVDVDV